MILLVTMLIPLAFGLALLAPGPVLSKERNIHTLAAVGTLLTLALSLVAAFDFSWTGAESGTFQHAGDVAWIPAFGLSFSFGADAISMSLLLLTTFLMPLVVFGSFHALHGPTEQRRREFFIWLLILESAMIGTFIARDVFFFYICFEFTLIPLYFLIGVFGSTQRLYAARVFFLYTFTGSMLTFAGVLYVAFTHASANDGQWSFLISDLVATSVSMSATEQGWVLLALLAGFAVKVPIFPVHTWLPLAHTEAPTAGSVILAGVLLKLGTYGLIRFAIPMCPAAVVTYAPLIATLAIIGILYTALICWVQKDIKKLIAYSSVSHLGFCVLGMFAVNMQGMGGSVAYMINHGLSTGALFLCVGMIYERFHTREMRQYGGLAKVMPVWSCFMVYFCLASVGLPGLNGFVGEFLTLLGAFKSPILGPGFAAAAGFGMIFAAIYILYMVGKVIFGEVKIPGGHGQATHEVKDLSLREIGVLTPLAIGCLLLGLFPTLMLQSFEAPIEQLTQAYELDQPIATEIDSESMPAKVAVVQVIDPEVSHD